MKTQDTIDSLAVESFIKNELSRLQTTFNKYAGISVKVFRHLHESGPGEYQVDWSAYVDGHGQRPGGSSDHAFNEMIQSLETLKRDSDPLIISQRLREQAAELIKRADELLIKSP